MTLHLVRTAEPPPFVVCDGDLVLYDRDGAWTLDGAAVTDAQLLDLVLAAARTAVW